MTAQTPRSQYLQEKPDVFLLIAPYINYTIRLLMDHKISLHLFIRHHHLTDY